MPQLAGVTYPMQLALVTQAVIGEMILGAQADGVRKKIAGAYILRL